MTDYVQSKYLEKFQESELAKQTGEDAGDDSFDEVDSDAILEELENELDQEDSGELQKYREARMNELSKEMAKSRNAIQENFQSGDNVFKDIQDEGELIKLSTKSPLVVIFFYNDTFKTCQLMDQSLEKLAYRHVTTRFYKIRASNAPFLAVKLGIKVLPCIVMYTNGLERGRIIGFEGLLEGNASTKPGDILDPFKHFKVENLEKVLLLNGMITRKAFDLKSIRSKQSTKDHYDGDYESDLDI